MVVFVVATCADVGPALAIGVVAYDAIRAAMQTPVIVAVALIVGGVMILLIERMVKIVRYQRVEAIPTGTAVSIGVVQCLAMLPGVRPNPRKNGGS